jgi:hypothetical protein
MSNHVSLRVEELGQRILPSTTSVMPLFPLFGIAQAAPLPATSTHPLAGQGGGVYIVNRAFNPLTAITAALHGTADLNRLGHTTLEGMLHTVGATTIGRATGVMTFSNLSGSTTINLTGPLQAAFADLPPQFAYAVTHSTGAYAHVTDTGTLTLTLTPATVGTAPPTLNGTTVGTFTTTIAGGIQVVRPPQLASGITGVALVGPTLPVVRPGQPDVKPLAFAVIAVEAASGGPVLARVTAAANGTFTIPLPPGTYKLIPMAPRPGELFPHAVAQPLVTVLPNEYTPVVVGYDSGIR